MLHISNRFRSLVLNKLLRSLNIITSSRNLISLPQVTKEERLKCKNRNMEYEKFYNEFQAPKHSVVGWDGRVVKIMMGSDKSVDYLAIVLSGAPNMMEGKILEVEEMTDSRGETQCQTTFNVPSAYRPCLCQGSTV